MRASEVNIARNIRVLEQLKAEMLDALAALFKNLITSGTNGLTDNIARLIVCSFLLAKRLGLSFGQVEQGVCRHVDSLLTADQEPEEWHEDIALLKEYLDMRR